MVGDDRASIIAFVSYLLCGKCVVKKKKIYYINDVVKDLNKSWNGEQNA